VIVKRRINPSLLVLSGVVLITAAVIINWLATRRQGQDFGYLYAAAVAIVTGAPLYNAPWQKVAFTTWGLPLPQGVFYPPATGFTSLPLAAVSFPVAQGFWFAFLTVVVTLGVWVTVKRARPDATTGLLALVAGVVLLSSCMRWGMTPLQGAPFVFALLAFFVVALHTNRPGLVFFIATYATAFKFTIAFPFLGLLLLHKRYGSMIGAVALAGILNLIGFARVGGWSALSDYRSGISTLESFGTVNSPDPWDPQSSQRLDWPYLFNGLSGHLEASRMLAIVAFALVCAWLLRKSQYIQRPVSLDVTAAFLVPLVCLSVVCIYHHHYDIMPLLVPFLIMFARFDQVRPFRNRWAVCLIAPLLAMMALLPIAFGQRLAIELVGPVGQGLFNLLLPVATTLTLVGSLVIVRQIVPGRESAAVSGGVAKNETSLKVVP
jgi:hypothetical protein